jgi:2-C-methyl-D-erythritol 2,4-cyclodiphosphate synthase
VTGPRVGFGFDAHAFAEGRPLVLGGAAIPGAPGLGGHSDADVLSHAITDALLGATGLGDLGAMFPGTDRWKDASSLAILSSAGNAAREAGWAVVNVDATVVAQSPSLAPYREEMATGIARALDVTPSAVSVKATSSDGLGFTGRREGIAAMAVVLVHGAGSSGD